MLNKISFKMHILLLASICIFLFTSCNGDNSENNKTKITLENYFKQQLWKYKTTNPPKETYNELIEVEKLQDTKLAIWKEWENANKKEIELFEKGIKEAPYIIKWNLPEESDMPVRYIEKNQQPDNGFPMFIHLHGGGAYDVANEKDAAVNSLSWNAEINRVKYTYIPQTMPSLNLIPRMPNDKKGDWSLKPERIAFKRLIQIGFLTGKINPKKVYLLGTSNGGYGTINLSVYMPDYFSAVASIAASIEPGMYMYNYYNLPLYMEVGENDSYVLRNIYAQQWQNELPKYSNPDKNKEYHKVVIKKNAPHDIEVKDIMDILDKYQREVSPEKIMFYYTNYKKDGYPQSVYYLDFRELNKNKDASCLFDITRENNNSYSIKCKNNDMNNTISGNFGIYLDDKTDFSKPVIIKLNDKIKFNSIVKLNKGTIAESIALFGDPLRIYAAKAVVSL